MIATKKIISIIIPILNEESNIFSLFSELSSFIIQHKTIYNFQVVIVDDGSSDNSLGLIEANKSLLNCALKIVKLSKNFGSYNALRAGVKFADGDIVTFTYADLQDPLELINRMAIELEKGNEIVIAQREENETKFFENLFSRFFAFTMRKIAIKEFPVKGFDVVMFNEKVKNRLNEFPEVNSSITFQILNLGFRKSFIGYAKSKRNSGKSKWTLKKKINLFTDSIVQYSSFPLRFISLVGLIMAISGFIWGAYLLFLKISGVEIESGWTALICLITTGFGMVLISLGIIAEYLLRTLDASRNRPIYIIDEIIETNNEK
jgi:glycosyltransferase involved in cell wall biosynthesis